MSIANQEQLKAIEHSGGVLLSAGAGSGKTFVLVEHIVYIIQEIIDLQWKKGEVIFVKELKKRFSSIVLMTFTKKATGELAIRLKNKLLNLSKEVGENGPWTHAVKQLDYLTVTTIHGFCLKLIRQGHFINAPENLEIISKNQQKEKVRDLYLRWLKNALDNHPDRGLIERFLRREKEILNSYQAIFSDAALRLAWKELTVSHLRPGELDQILNIILEDQPFKDLYTKCLDLSGLEKFKDKDWYIFVQSFERIFPRSFNMEAIKALTQFKNSIEKVPRQPNNNGIDDFKEYFQSIKKLFKFLDDEAQDFILYDKHFDTHVLPLLKLYQELFQYIDSHYFDEPGIVFSDLETIVYEGLSNSDAARKIGDVFHYFIVDEFQDTSKIQFSIIEKIIQGDLKKLFCVGDLKQAIYGFRGGELGVFQDLMKVIPQSLKLTNNYRSQSAIINFNNNVFDFLFQKGIKFEGFEKYRIEVDAQTIPPEKNILDEGQLSKFLLDVPLSYNEKESIIKLSNAEMNFYESLGIVDYLKNLHQSCPQTSVAILYRKLSPVSDLIKLLIKEKLSFTAQVKIPFLHDPIIGLFKTLIECELEEKTVTHHLTNFLVKAYLNILEQSKHEVEDEYLEKLILKFTRNRQLMGVQTAFWQFLFDIGLANSNYQNNLKTIKSLIEIGASDLSKIWSALENLNEENYSIDFQYGESPNSIVIMTAHASKGLEFPNVILAGIHTNGQERVNDPYLGKMPGSFKWKLELKKESEFKTPQYWQESYLNEHKNFAESKRLFYVAATRAQENLIWFDFKNYSEVCKEVANSWVIGLRKFEGNIDTNSLIIHETIKKSSKEISLKNDQRQYGENPPHFFHLDPLGLSLKEISNELLVVTDLSVTRLAALAECPRKFYLKNICKIDEDDAKKIKTRTPHSFNEDENNFVKLYREEVLIEEMPINSEKAMGRGTFIHQIISTMIKRNWVIPRSLEIGKDLKSVEWVTQELIRWRDEFNFISEEPLKFPIFGHMISGTPDLIIVPKIAGGVVKIWDFKTGKRKPTHEINYWFQLYLYAFACFELGFSSPNSTVELTLAYVDNQELVTKIFTNQQIFDLIKQSWEKLDYLDEVNLNHCERCPYQNLCS